VAENGQAEQNRSEFASRLDQTDALRHPADVLRFIIHFTRGLIREQRARRSVMFFAMLGALVWLFLGATFLDAPLRATAVLFVLYWLACAWVTLLVVLLALFDLLMVRAAARRERRRLAQEMLKTQNPRDEDAR
jgi:hypothetical protein